MLNVLASLEWNNRNTVIREVSHENRTKSVTERRGDSTSHGMHVDFRLDTVHAERHRRR